MTEQQPPGHYTSVAKALHWIIALMIIVQIPAGIVMHEMAFSDTKFLMYQMHKSFGLIVLGLSLFRLYWRLSHKAPPLPEGMGTLERIGARATHVGFYVLIIAIPLTGWLMVSASTTGIDTKLFFFVPVPHWPVPVSEAAEEFFAETHELLAKGTIALIVLHIAAALRHHFISKDATLLRMLPTPLAQRLSLPAAPLAPRTEEQP